MNDGNALHWHEPVICPKKLARRPSAGSSPLRYSAAAACTAVGSLPPTRATFGWRQVHAYPTMNNVQPISIVAKNQ